MYHNNPPRAKLSASKARHTLDATADGPINLIGGAAEPEASPAKLTNQLDLLYSGSGYSGMRRQGGAKILSSVAETDAAIEEGWECAPRLGEIGTL